MIEIRPVSENGKYDVAYFKNRTQYHSVCDTKEKIIDAVSKYLDMCCDANLQQGTPITGNDTLNRNSIRATKGETNGKRIN